MHVSKAAGLILSAGMLEFDRNEAPKICINSCLLFVIFHQPGHGKNCGKNGWGFILFLDKSDLGRDF